MATDGSNEWSISVDARCLRMNTVRDKVNPLHRLVCVKWQDAKGVNQRWEHLNEYADEPLDFFVYSCGYVLRESERVLHIAGHVYVDDDGDVQFCGDIQIPKGMIIDQWEID